MAYEIEWTPKARGQYREIVYYITETWSVEVASKFIDTVKKKVELIALFPQLGRSSYKRKQVRKYPLTR